MRAILLITTTVFALLVLPTLAQSLANNSRNTTADTGIVTVPVQPGQSMGATGDEASLAGTLPTRGMTMRQVEQSHGVPQVRKSPVGNPPITRWEYPGFVVYFEYRHVIHSVTKITQ